MQKLLYNEKENWVKNGNLPLGNNCGPKVRASSSISTPTHCIAEKPLENSHKNRYNNPARFPRTNEGKPKYATANF